MAPKPKPQPVRKANPLKNRAPIKAPPPTLVRQAAAGAAAAAARAATQPTKRACPNKECSAPTVLDGICHNCGFIVEESSIVSEVTFGENSSGAAVVQGSYVSADQSGARSTGLAFQRSGGGEDRESTIRDGRRYMQSMGAQLLVNDSTIQAGMQIFKLAAMSNFIQGRRMDMVAAVCLYSACRKTTPCKVMLIDFADLVQANVFKLGHTFKKLHEAITIAKEGIQPVLPEDLIFRFAKRLEFGPMMTKVAEDAIRMVQRMSMDWMVMGRRPSGVCGACLILAARMNNFRRTITEVVYIVKVTTHTIQKRLEEFKQTPSSALTVEEFLHNEFLESAHDPPSFYEKTEEFQKTKKRRKRRGHDGEHQEEDGSGSENGESESPSPNKRQKTANPEAASSSGTATDNQTASTPESTPQPAQPAQPPVELRRDADGFVIPPQPTQSHDIPIDPELMESAIEEQSGTTLEKLNDAFNDAVVPAEEEEDEIDAEIAAVIASNPLKRKRVQKDIMVPEPWQSVESQMEKEIGEIVSDPHSLEHAEQYAQAQVNVAAYMSAAEQTNPPKEISMDAYIDESEFADDPEVANCLLSAADVARKEKVWVNANKDWLRKQQLKLWAKKEAENGPPKARRNRKKKPRIGEGQTSPASSPGDAAVNALKLRSFSKKINYDAIHSLLGHDMLGDKSALGSAATSRITSRAGSEMGDSDNESEMSSVAASTTGSIASSAMGEDIRVIRGPKPRTRGSRSKGKAKAVPEKVATPEPNEDEDEDGDDDDYIKPAAAEPAPTEEDEEEDWRSSLKKSQTPAAQGDEQGFEEDEEEYEDFGGIEPGGLGDDDTAFGDNTGYGDDDDQDEYGGDDYDE